MSAPAYRPILTDFPVQQLQLAVDVAIDLAYGQGRIDEHRAAGCDRSCAAQKIGAKVDQAERDRLDEARSGIYRSAGERRTAATDRVVAEMFGGTS